jgi:trimethylamine---corrinoid protein Co-methyltransferase
MGSVKGILKLFSDIEMEKLHSAALDILQNTGMWIEAQEARDYYKQAGCRVNNGTKIVRFPKKISQNYIDLMKQKYSDDSEEAFSNNRYSRTFFTKRNYQVHTDFTANAGGFSMFVLDKDNTRRKATMEDVIDGIELADSLENIDMVGLPCSAQEIPFSERPIKMTAELLKRTKKLGGIETWNKRDVHAIAEMCDLISGSRENSIKTPLLIGYAETRSPLCFDKNMSDIFIEYAKLGFPQANDTMPCSGTTAPATLASTIALGLAESIASVVLGFAVNPDVRMGIILNPSAIDMKTFAFPYASPDKMTLVAGMTQMLHGFYGCPTGVHAGKTDSCIPNIQAGFEKALSSITPIMFGAEGIGTLGNLEPGGITFSPVQLVIDNEIIGYIRRIIKGFEVNEDTLALDLINEISPGGNYMSSPHTIENFRKEFYLSDLPDRISWNTWNTKKLKTIEEKAYEEIKKNRKKKDQYCLSEDKIKEINKIVSTFLQNDKY